MNNDKTIKIKLKELLGEEYLDYYLSIESVWGEQDIVDVLLEKDGSKKRLYYNIELERPVSNLLDGSYGYFPTRDDLIEYIGDKEFGKDFDDCCICNLDDYSILFSYNVDGKVRSFVGLNNTYVGVSYPIGFDLNKQEFIRFPINQFGLIDDYKMKEYLSQDKQIGYDPKEYQLAVERGELSYAMRSLLGDDYIYNKIDTCSMVLSKLSEYNYETTCKIRQMVDEKLAELEEKRNRI